LKLGEESSQQQSTGLTEIGNTPFTFDPQKSKYMNFPAELRYTKDHEWVHIEGDVATIGITDFAQGELGDIVFVEIETQGQSFDTHEVFGTVEAVKTVSDLYMPVAGEILEVNPGLADDPASVNTDPYGKGWMIKVKIKSGADMSQLMDAATYEATL
jgi:glycine cleavage system H protein